MALPVAFLSHATKDGEIASRLAKDLRAKGIDVWYSKWEIRPGDSLRMKIDEGLDAASFFLVLLTPTSLKSKWVQTEMDTGLVDRIKGKTRFIPILLGISSDEVPATLRGLLWVRLEPYEEGLRQLVAACFDVSDKPPLGKPPAWATAQPLQGSGLSPQAQQLVKRINECAEVAATTYESFEADELAEGLDLTDAELRKAASELEDEGYVQLIVDTGSGARGFSALEPRPRLFFETDPLLRGNDPAADAVELAAAMINLASAPDGEIELATVDRHLGWGPRRLNPAAEYLREYGYVEASETVPCAPFAYADAFLSDRTRRFVERARRKDDAE